MWDVDLREVATHIREADPVWFGLSVIVVTATFPLRALRWKVLLRTAWPAARLKPLWHATAIGFMANNVLPARAGELVRSYAGNRLVGMPFSTALASIAVERIFDGVVLVGLLLLAVMSPGFPAGARLGSTSITTLATSMSALFVGALLFLIVLVQNRERAAPPIERLLRRVLPARFGEKGVAIFRNLVTGLAVLRSGREVLVVLVWSLAVWLTNALSYILAFRAFDTDVPAVTSLVLQGVVAIGVAVPQAPGFFGVFEGLSRLVLGLYGVPANEAIGFAIGVHMGWFVPITIIGLVILMRTGLSLRDLRSDKAPAAGTP